MQFQPPPLPALLPPGAAEVRADALPPPALSLKDRWPLYSTPCHPPVSYPTPRERPRTLCTLSPPPLPPCVPQRCCHRGHRDICMWEHGRGLQAVSRQRPGSWHSFSEIPRDPWQLAQRDVGLLIHPVPAVHPRTHPHRRGQAGWPNPSALPKDQLLTRAPRNSQHTAAPPPLCRCLAKQGGSRSCTVTRQDEPPSLTSPLPSPATCQAPSGVW